MRFAWRFDVEHEGRRKTRRNQRVRPAAARHRHRLDAVELVTQRLRSLPVQELVEHQWFQGRAHATQGMRLAPEQQAGSLAWIPSDLERRITDLPEDGTFIDPYVWRPSKGGVLNISGTDLRRDYRSEGI